ncbi:hypothetical protein KJ657_01890 [Patescibacteria group bacterium]|nr:hypothetical protein [Patescibacteria group bacterium]MBU1015819.1 hypothetical protein [Patescibacteria group bacterium]MBU1685238.1 hypothetical protein [Patescibacteria group bacterium]MBU1938247.1 hypothetical protein [Patescibacteria group bacterium]
MKKLIFVFVTLFVIVLISGCGARQNTIRYNNGSQTGETAETTEETTKNVETDESDGNDSEAVVDETGTEEEVAGETNETEEESESETDEISTGTTTGKLEVTSFDNAYLKTNLSYNVVSGTARSGTQRITVNEYELQKFIPGQTNWSYIAATRLNTLEEGLNTYVIKGYDSNDKQTDSIIFSIDYEAPTTPEALPNVGSSHWLALMISLLFAGSYAFFRRLKWL